MEVSFFETAEVHACIAGIESDGPGYQRINIKPHPPSPKSNGMQEPINWVKSSYDSIRGTIRSDWRMRDSKFELKISIPPNTTATVYLPTSEAESITEGGQRLSINTPHINVISSSATQTVLSVASGDYQFVATSSLAPAGVALKTSKPKDKSLNPEKVDLHHANKIAHWNFTDVKDRKEWEANKSVSIQVRDGKAFLVAAGNDSQIIASTSEALTGKLAIELRAMPSKGADSQFFWTETNKGFSAARQSQRTLQPTDRINSYLFKVDAKRPIWKLRFDPFAHYDDHANKGEMQIESISIYQLPEKQTGETESKGDTSSASVRGKKSFPNILFFLSEDQGAHLSHLGTAGLQTPNIDALARSGTYFNNAFVVYSVCSASKAAMYTGLHSHTNGILNNTLNFHKPASKVSAAEKGMKLARINRIRDKYLTLTEILKANGYYQGVTHKLHVLPNEKFPYDEFLNEDPANIDQFLERASKQDRPWFLMVNMPYSHRPYPNSDKTAIGVNPAEVELPAYLPDTPLARKDWSEYLGGIEKVDAVVGRTMKTLKDLRQADHTIVIYLSDHGPTFPHGKMTLYDLGLRIPMIVSGPGIIRRASSELVSELNVLPTLLDLIASQSKKQVVIPGSGSTGELPYRVHGKSLKDIITGKSNATGHKYIFGQISNRGPLPNDGIQERSVFDGRWKLIYRENVDRRWRQVNADSRMFKTWGNRSYAETIRVKEQFPEAYRVLREMDPQKLGGNVPSLELYDLKTDPDEMNNLASVPSQVKNVTRLKNALKNWAERNNDTAVSVN